MPAGLLQCLTRGFHGEQNEAIHLLLFLGWSRQVRIETRLRVIRQGRHRTADLGRQIGNHLIRQITQPGTPGQQPLPDHFDTAPQRRHQAHACYNHTTIIHTAHTSI
ncbi:hypothetical protein D9M73_177270 [compost metagenome]